jgi:hypothetical protein
MLDQLTADLGTLVTELESGEGVPDSEALSKVGAMLADQFGVDPDEVEIGRAHV